MVEAREGGRADAGGGPTVSCRLTRNSFAEPGRCISINPKTDLAQNHILEFLVTETDFKVKTD